jgi:hypothetical protein
MGHQPETPATRGERLSMPKILLTAVVLVALSIALAHWAPQAKTAPLLGLIVFGAIAIAAPDQLAQLPSGIIAQIARLIHGG